MSKLCSNCGDSSFSWEGGFNVCTSCGVVADNYCLVNDETPLGTANAVQDFHPTTANERRAFAARNHTPSMSCGKRIGLAFTRRIAQCLQCKAGMTDEAVKLFERIFCHPTFRSRQSSAKRALAACSVYIVCRQYDWPLSIKDVSQFADCSPEMVDFWKRKVICTFDDLQDVRPVDLLQLVETRCQMSGFGESIRQRASQLLSLCRDLWITEGRRPDNVITVVCYFAWQNENPASFIRTTLPKFCRQHMISFSSSMNMILNRTRSILCQMAKQIPWVVADSINERNVVLHIKDILDLRETLLADARAQMAREPGFTDDDEGISACEQYGENELTISPSAMDNGSEKNSTVEPTNEPAICYASGLSDIDENIPSAPKRTAKKRGKGLNPLDPTWPTQLKQLKLNPCHLEAANTNTALRAVASHPNMDAAELCTNDIADNELHLYIKCREEIVHGLPAN